MLGWMKRLYDRLALTDTRVVSMTQSPYQRPKFKHDKAAQEFLSWVYVAAQLNAIACSSVPLRLYVRKKPGIRLFKGRPVSHHQRRYLGCDLAHRPSLCVSRKAAEMDDMVEAIDHPALDLLETVNPYSNGFEFAMLRHIFLQLTGNAYTHIIFNRVSGRPGELWTLPAQHMWIIRGDRDKGEWLKGYVYGNDPRSGHEFEPDEVGHWKYPNPNDQYYGLGKVEAGWDVVQQNQAQHELDTSFLKNYARPDYAVIIKGGANPEAMRKAEAELKSLVKGRNKAGSFVRFTGDVNIVPLSFPPKDLSGREEIVEEVAGVFGVPVTKMKANDPNRANAETGDAGWMRDTILPMLRMDEQKLNEWYLPLWGIEDDAFLAYEDPVPANQQEARAERESLFRVGAITVNEIRAETGREPVRASEADESLVAAGLIPLTQVGQQSGYSTPGGPSIPFTVSRPASPTVPSVPSDAPKPAAGTGIAAAAGGGDVASAGLNGAQIQALQAILEAVTAGLAAPDAAIEMIQAAFPFLKPERIQRMVHAASAFRPVNRLPDSQPQQPSERAIAQRTWRPWTDYKADADTDVRETPESVVQRYMIALDKILLSMRDEILSALDAGIPIGDAASRVLQATEVWTPQLDNAVRDVLSQGLSIGAEAAGRALGLDISFDLQRPEVQRWLSDYTPKLVRTLADEGLARRVQDVVQQGASEGIGTAEIADRIRKMDGFTDDGIANRSELIARTELANAHTQGQIEAWDQSGVVKGKRWLLAPQACPFCEAAAKIFNAENLSLRDVPEGLEKGSTLTGTNGETMKLGYRSIDSPPLHPQCRCGIEPILEGD